MPHVVGGADTRAAVVRGGLDVDAPERGLVEDLAVHDAVERHAAGEAEIVDARSLVELPQHPEDDLLEPSLEGRRHVLVVRLQRPVAASRSEVAFHRRAPERRQLGRPAVPRHRGALDVVPEVVEAELVAEAVAPDDPAEDVQVLRLPVGGEAHHLVLVAVLGEAEVLRDGRVEDAERVRERHLAARSVRADPPRAPTSRSPCPRTRRSIGPRLGRTATRSTRTRCALGDVRRSAPSPSGGTRGRRDRRRAWSWLAGSCRGSPRASSPPSAPPCPSAHASLASRGSHVGSVTARNGRGLQVGVRSSRGSSGSIDGGRRCRA